MGKVVGNRQSLLMETQAENTNFLEGKFTIKMKKNLKIFMSFDQHFSIKK